MRTSLNGPPRMSNSFKAKLTNGTVKCQLKASTDIERARMRLSGRGPSVRNTDGLQRLRSPRIAQRRLNAAVWRVLFITTMKGEKPSTRRALASPSLQSPFREGLHGKGLDACRFGLVSIDHIAKARAHDDGHIRSDGKDLFCELTPVISGMVWSVMTRSNWDGSDFKSARACRPFIRDVTS